MLRGRVKMLRLRRQPMREILSEFPKTCLHISPKKQAQTSHFTYSNTFASLITGW